MKSLILFTVLSAFSLFGAEKQQKFVIRAEDSLTELVKEELQEVQRKSKAGFVLCREKSGNEILVISPDKEKNALEVIPWLRKGFLFLVNPYHPGENISKDEAEKILRNEQHEWRKSGRKIRNIYYLKGILTPAPAKKGKTRQIALPYADLAEKMLKSDPESIVILPLDSLMSPQDAKILAVDGIKPDFESVTQDRYPMQKLYYIQRLAEIPEAHELVSRLRERKFRKMILESGAIPVPDTEKAK